MHLQIVDLIDEETTMLETEQDALDRHDDEITGLTIHLQKIIAKCSGPDIIANWKVLSHKLSYLECGLKAVGEALSVVREGHDNVPLLEQYCEQLADCKKWLAAIYEDLVTLDLEEEDDLVVLHAHLEKLLFRCLL